VKPKETHFKAPVVPAGRPFVISGPCAAETETQVLETARLLAADGRVDYFRAGVWKPRTMPGSFEGNGQSALPWLQRVQRETGLRVIIEVAKPAHVEAALEAGMDAFWIGARTTVNPFLVQELADALRGTDLPVFVKNPINPDAKLWAGAVERIRKAGITSIGLIHRGFSHYGRTEYRNPPHWQIPIQMMVEYPDSIMLCDPSHIGGRRDLIFEIAQKALNLNFDGIMVEVHPQPAKALSDASQQLTPKAFADVLDRLILRKDFQDDERIQQELGVMRSDIDDLDAELVRLLAKRMELVAHIGRFKKANGITILQRKRWEQIMKRFLEMSAQLGLREDFARQIITRIHEESIKRQEEIFGQLKIKN